MMSKSITFHMRTIERGGGMFLNSRMEMKRTSLRWKMRMAFLRGCQTKQEKRACCFGEGCFECALKPLLAVRGQENKSHFQIKYPAMGRWTVFAAGR